jgi:crotonobetainyl-CoA:carnitine CoA-transferase CaiB-like acyl-CoA transferase
MEKCGCRSVITYSAWCSLLRHGSYPDNADREHWREAKAKLAALFKTRTQDEWCALLEETDA